MKKTIYIFMTAMLLIALKGVTQDTETTTTMKQIKPPVQILEHMIILNYSIGFPTGDTEDFISKTSFRSFGFEYRRIVNNKWSAGLSFDWQRYYESMGKQTFDYKQSTLYGSQFNYMNTIPIMVTGFYYFGGVDGDLITYVGTGVGTYYNELYFDIGSARFYSDSWQFGLAPQAGIIYNIGKDVGLSAGFRYNYGFETDKLDPQSYWTIRIGLAWLF